MTRLGGGLIWNKSCPSGSSGSSFPWSQWSISGSPVSAFDDNFPPVDFPALSPRRTSETGGFPVSNGTAWPVVSGLHLSPRRIAEAQSFISAYVSRCCRQISSARGDISVAISGVSRLPSQPYSRNRLPKWSSNLGSEACHSANAKPHDIQRTDATRF